MQRKMHGMAQCYYCMFEGDDMRSMMIALLYCCSTWVLAAPPAGSVRVMQAGALIHYGVLSVALDMPDAADLRLQLPSNGAAPRVLVAGQVRHLPLWQSFVWRKNGVQLRITALPFTDSATALLLDFGNNDYRILLAGSASVPADDAMLAQRYPGADLFLLLRNGQRVMMMAETGRLQVSPYRFDKARRQAKKNHSRSSGSV